MAVPRLTKPGADTGVAELQQALKVYATKMNYPPADPGEVDGIVDEDTATAVMMVLPRIAGKVSLPSEVTGLLTLGGTVALLSPDVADQIYKLIRSYAGYITAGVLAAAVVETAAGGSSSGSSSNGGSAVINSVKNRAQQINVNYGTVYAPAPAVIRTPDGSLVPGNPTQSIWYKSWLTGYYRVASPRGAGLSSAVYSNYIEVAPSMSKPATGTEVDRNTFYRAVGKWYGTTPGMIGIGIGAVGLGLGTFMLARR